MGNPFQLDSPAYYDRLRTDLETFRSAYIPYIQRTGDDVYAGMEVVHDDERTHVMKLSVPAHAAVHASGIQVAWLPPQAIASSTPPAEGLTALAFAHESSAYRGLPSTNSPTSYEATVDIIDRADAFLEERWKRLRRKRRQPSYWADRLVRVVLGFPAYLFSVMLGFDRRNLSASKAQVLWAFSVLADIAAFAGLGRTIGWW